MKRGTPNHPKVAALAQVLACPRALAVGVLELLWHWTARYAPQGDIGRWSDENIAMGAGWEGDPHVLVAALVKAGWVNEHPRHRLVVHDWHDHADESVKKFLSRNGKPFLSGGKLARGGSVPSVYFIQAEESGAIKIGFTEVAIEARIAALQTGNPQHLRLLCAYPARRHVELSLHKRFAALCVSNEWFRPEEALLSFIKERLAGQEGSRRRRTTADNGRQRPHAIAVAVPLPSPGPVAGSADQPTEPQPTPATPDEARAVAVDRLGPRSNPLVDREALEPEYLQLVRDIAAKEGIDPIEVAGEVGTWKGSRKINPAAMSSDRLLNTVLDLRRRLAAGEDGTKHGLPTTGPWEKQA